MKEVYYVYISRQTQEYKSIADRGRRLSDVEVDVLIAHQERAMLGTTKWHKVTIDPAPAAQCVKWPKVACENMAAVQDKLACKKRQGLLNWQSLLTLNSVSAA
ncbi:MAG: hypothetical protein SVU69_13755 [Pseudomonadota bacterium]|nr:hypothetical protein [Pseudomonadota bacterium]